MAERPNKSNVGVRRDSKSVDVSKGVKRSDSLTKDEKTENNTKAREREMRQSVGNNGQRPRKFVQRSGESGLKRRHTVGGTRDFDKVILDLIIGKSRPFMFIRLNRRCESAGWPIKVMRKT